MTQVASRIDEVSTATAASVVQASYQGAGGLDDGDNKYTSDVLFLIWNALKAEGIEMPYPRRVVEIKGALPSG